MDYLSIFVTLKLALITTVVLMILGAPVAYILAYSKFPGKSLVEAFLYLPTALPPTVIGFYLVIVLGPKGFLGRSWEAFTGGSILFTFLGIAIASVVYSVSFAIQPMKAAFQKIDRRLIENAFVLGLSKREVFFRVALPNSISGIAAAAILVFLHSIGAFGVLIMVGGSIAGETKVASIEIYEAVEMMDYRKAGLISLSFLPISYVFLLIANKLNRDS